MTEKKVCSICNGNGTVMIGDKCIRCHHCNSRDIIASPRVVGYKTAKPVVKKVKPAEEIARDWK